MGGGSSKPAPVAPVAAVAPPIATAAPVAATAAPPIAVAPPIAAVAAAAAPVAAVAPPIAATAPIAVTAPPIAATAPIAVAAVAAPTVAPVAPLSGKKTLTLAKFTTLLGSLVTDQTKTPLDGRPMNPSTLQLEKLIDPKCVGQYEAILTVLSYFTRLNYEKGARLVTTMFKFLNYSPIVFNTALSYAKYATLPETSETDTTTTAPNGYMLYVKQQDNRASITVHNELNVFPGETVLIISFKGTLSPWAMLKDLNASYRKLTDLYGPDLFKEVAETAKQRQGSSPVNPFGAHTGFVSGMMGSVPGVVDSTGMYGLVIEKINYLLEQTPTIKRIIVTGHSLGGAFASLMGLGLAQMKKKGSFPNQTLHLATFGCPKLVSDYTRNVFNGLLMEMYITLDRVTTAPRYNLGLSVADPVPLVPPHMDHIGFMVLKSETKTQSRTGRTKHVRELRDELANIKAQQNLLSTLVSRNYSPLPYYEEFFQWFSDTQKIGITAADYKGMIESTPNGTIRVGSTDRAKKVKTFVTQTLGITAAAADKASADEAAAAKTVEKEAATHKGDMGAIETIEAAENPGPAGQNTAKQQQTTVVAVGGRRRVRGGGANTDRYKADTVTYQPNHVAYSCSQITAGMPVMGCHLGYMGVSGVGTLSTNVFKGKTFNKYVELFHKSNGWTYRLDVDKKLSSPPIANTNIKATTNVAKVPGTITNDPTPPNGVVNPPTKLANVPIKGSPTLTENPTPIVNNRQVNPLTGGRRIRTARRRRTRRASGRK